jgi:ParB family chromosome partitioning protein
MDTCLLIDIREAAPGAGSVEGLADFAPARDFTDAHAQWQERLPQDPEALWAALLRFSAEDRDALFAHCAAFAVDAVIEPYNRRPRAIAHADALASELALDMRAAGWTPTAAGYFGRITKAHILSAVREAKGDAAAERIADMKKPEMAAAAEELLKESDWLPSVLRTRGLRVEYVPAIAAELPALPAIAAE